MGDSVGAAFESQVLTLPLSSLLLVRKISYLTRQGKKYQRIEASVREVGIIEPLVVSRPVGNDGQFLLLDGYARYNVLVELGRTEAKCLIAKDDEAFTYNKRTNGLAPVQEHFMIVRALENGVPEERLSKALNLDIASIRLRSMLLDRICPEVIDMLKDKIITRSTFDSLRKMKPMRQIEVAELLLTANNFTLGYSKALLAATRQSDLVNPEQPKKVSGLSTEQMARMEREMSSLQQDFKEVEASYGDDVLHLVTASGYMSKLVANDAVNAFLLSHYPDLLEEFTAVISAGSLDQAPTPR